MNQERGTEFEQSVSPAKKRKTTARKKQSQTQPLVTLGGTATEGSSGPPLGLVDLGTSDGAYLLRVALPGVRHNKCKLKLNVQGNGRVDIEGLVADSEFLKASAKKYQMKVQELAPPGSFGVSFKLPGPIDARLTAPNFMSNGILEVVFRKEKLPYSGSMRIPPKK